MREFTADKAPETDEKRGSGLHRGEKDAAGTQKLMRALGSAASTKNKFTLREKTPSHGVARQHVVQKSSSTFKRKLMEAEQTHQHQDPLAHTYQH